MNSDRSFIESITDYPAPHYEGFLRYPTSSSAMSALVPSSIALSVPSTSAIIVTSSAATRGWRRLRGRGRGVKGGIVPPLISIYAPLVYAFM
ncbi:uncharacterized protein LOC105849927 isoform X5 [Hydra vulgaris]|uniref:uncharacterized protein LOC105849927 isoform X5 n=1 Tax=Hydra vulgaris TaxID=6087 RepID=UPI0032EA4CED